MAAPQPSASPAPGTPHGQQRDRVAEALYTWCLDNFQVGHVFDQQALLSSPAIPNRDLKVLLSSSSYLVSKNLFKLHDIKGANGLGWELVSQERAANYAGLTRDEHLVYASIDSAGTNGIWTRHVMKRLNAHAKVLERTLKTLEHKGIIRSMKNVKFPNRKMFIVAGLQPSEEVTGGAWFTDQKLDTELLLVVSETIEDFVSHRSWVEVANQTQPLTDRSNNKRKTPHDGFDVKGKGKAKVARLDDNQPRSESPELHRKSKHSKRGPKSYVPQAAGHHGYPTLPDITRYINNSKVTTSIFPQNAIQELLDIMVYDERLFKMSRPIRGDELPDEGSEDTINMYRCFNSPSERQKMYDVVHMSSSVDEVTRKAGRRLIELEDIGRGGTSEIPCLRCPAFDLCGDGGPVNVITCPYYDEWYLRACKADKEVDPWPEGKDFVERGDARRKERLKTLPAAPVKAEAKEEATAIVVPD